jgi:predicted CoA-binding protein
VDTTERILRDFSRIAVVGFSSDPSKASHALPAKLARAGFHILAVNPKLEQALGRPAYKRLQDIPPEEGLEVVLVFRPSAEAPDIALQAVRSGARALWLQDGIRSDEARATAEGAGLLYVEDRCIGVEQALLRITKG